VFVPDRGFALTMLTNADSAVGLRVDLTITGDWLLERFDGESNQELDPGPENTASEAQLAFYRDDNVVPLDAAGNPTTIRADFLPGANGDIAWFRLGGNLYRRMD
jgi:hypothetical protein